ncbi:hypothetical protein QR680_005020 [Steinernema hermaphroditum]|uniref:Ureidoglycolate hydrolase n=1 Tax=Steinernema hermaphroditum TaxID=289476 RepID=A0AA39HQK9_9BILA|nr:hypothetical protein QR680_005020 [Steinernema hermaphroditum]
MEFVSIPVFRWSEEIGFVKLAKAENVTDGFKKVPFPAATRRSVEGGDGGDFVKKDNQLAQSISSKAEGLHFNGVLRAHFDGDVAYVPSEQATFVVLVKVPESHEGAEFVAIEIPTTVEAIVIEAGVYHSLIALDGKVATFSIFFRETEIIDSIPLAAALNTSKASAWNLKKKALESRTDGADPKLDGSFSTRRLSTEKPTAESFAPYGKLFEKVENYKEHVACLPFKGHLSASGPHLLSQDFRMEWIEGDAPGTKKIQFSGLTGSFAGGQGCPGVVKDSNGVISADLIMTRPDGSFCVEPIADSDEFLMFLATPGEDKEPTTQSLKAFTFKGITPILAPEVWHSVPIPTAEKIVFRETISVTNANVVINVSAESGKPMSAQL